MKKFGWILLAVIVFVLVLGGCVAGCVSHKAKAKKSDPQSAQMVALQKEAEELQKQLANMVKEKQAAYRKAADVAVKSDIKTAPAPAPVRVKNPELETRRLQKEIREISYQIVDKQHSLTVCYWEASNNRLQGAKNQAQKDAWRTERALAKLETELEEKSLELQQLQLQQIQP